MRVLFVVNKCKVQTMNYVRSVARGCEQSAALVTYPGHPNVHNWDLLVEDQHLPKVSLLHSDSVRDEDIDLEKFEQELRAAIADLNPQVIHVLFYLHDHIVLRVRSVLDDLGHRAALIYETRDPTGVMPRDLPEREAIEASDGYIFVSEEIYNYFFNRYLIEPRPYLVIRQSEFYARRDELPKKRSDEDGMTHVSLLGTFRGNPENSRHYEEYIQAFLRGTKDTVLHAFSHRPQDYLDRLETEFEGRCINHNPHGPTMDPRQNWHYTSTIGTFDFNLVAHSLWRPKNSREMLRYCNPTKATSPLILADLPLICNTHYSGTVEIIEEFGCGHVFRDWSELNQLFQEKHRWASMQEGARAAAKALCHEAQSEKVLDFYRSIYRTLPATLRPSKNNPE